MRKVVSRDGTTIAYEKAGDGPPIVLLGGGFRDHSTFTSFVPHLAPRLTTFIYDRRGRGESGDAPGYAVEREIEDLEALIAEAGGEAAVFGGSTGGMLAMEAAMAGAAISKLILLEPPYRLPEAGAPRLPENFTANLRSLLAAGKRTEAAEYFLAGLCDFPAEEIARWRQLPMWPANEAMAHTLLYDTIIHGEGRLPAGRMATTDIPTLVIHSDSTSGWLRAASERTAAALPDARLVCLPGVWHRVPPEVLGPALTGFVTS